MEKSYFIEVKLQFTNFMNGQDEEHAILGVKEMFQEQYGIELADDEIVSVEEIEIGGK